MQAPINETQREFAKLCELGGGLKGGPAKGKVLDLISSSGKRLNARAYQTANEQLAAHPQANPWHVCFAIGVAWGHLAKMETEFTTYACNALADLNDPDLDGACEFYLDRGPEPIRQSLNGGYSLFQKVTLPDKLPNTLKQLGDAQQRWLSPILHRKQRPAYIGSWNATAMFMAALFAQPDLAKTQREAIPILPPGGPITTGLKMLHAGKIVSKAPAGTALDDAAFEPGALYENNALLVELVKALPDWCLLDVHSGVYMLGTRDPQSNYWI